MKQFLKRFFIGFGVGAAVGSIGALPLMILIFQIGIA